MPYCNFWKGILVWLLLLSSACSFISTTMKSPTTKFPQAKKAMSLQKLDLHAVIRAGDIETLKKAIEAGAYLEKRNAFQQTPLHTAVAHSNLEASQLLIEAGVNIEALSEGKTTPVYLALRHPVILELLIAHGADIHSKTYGGMEPIHSALLPEAVDILVRHGADVNVATSKGLTPLHQRTLNCQMDYPPESIQTLLNLGADPNMQDRYGKTPLFFAAKCTQPGNRYKTVEMLLQGGANPNLRDNRDRRPSDVFKKQPRIQKLLAQYETKFNPIPAKMIPEKKEAPKMKTQARPLTEEEIQTLKKQLDKVIMALKELYRACNSFWDQEGEDKVCDPKDSQLEAHGYQPSPEIIIKGGEEKAAFFATGNFVGGTQTLVMDATGNIN